jgi:hypothetical protein
MGIFPTLRTRLAIARSRSFRRRMGGSPDARDSHRERQRSVSFLPSGESDWTQARVNRPVWTGDRLWIDRGARAELQLGGAAVFIAAESSVAVLDYDNDRAQFELTQGTVDIYVRSLDPNDSIEIDTPNLAFVVRRPGEYRIDVRPDGESTAVAVVRGEGEAFGARSAYTLRAGQGFRFFGTDLADYNAEPLQRLAAFDSWVATRVQRYERSASARYVSQDMIGYADLDSYGTWRTVSNYGAVWVPSRVDAEWAPYRYGHWNWVEPWGWTWIDDAPWGFAPFHYGRWAHVDNRYWAWVPGPRNAAPVYAPALGRLRRRRRLPRVGFGRSGRGVVPARAGRDLPSCVQREPRVFHARQRHQHGGERDERHQRLQQPAHDRRALRQHQQRERGHRGSCTDIRAGTTGPARGRAHGPQRAARNAGRRRCADCARQGKRRGRRAAGAGEAGPTCRGSQSDGKASAAAGFGLLRPARGSIEAATREAARPRRRGERCAA